MVIGMCSANVQLMVLQTIKTTQYIASPMCTDSTLQLTANGIIDGLPSLLYAQCELAELWADLVASVIEHKCILKVSHRVEHFSLLV